MGPLTATWGFSKRIGLMVVVGHARLRGLIWPLGLVSFRGLIGLDKAHAHRAHRARRAHNHVVLIWLMGLIGLVGFMRLVWVVGLTLRVALRFIRGSRGS